MTHLCGSPANERSGFQEGQSVVSYHVIRDLMGRRRRRIVRREMKKEMGVMIT